MKSRMMNSSRAIILLAFFLLPGMGSAQAMKAAKCETPPKANDVTGDALPE